MLSVLFSPPIATSCADVCLGRPVGDIFVITISGFSKMGTGFARRLGSPPRVRGDERGKRWGRNPEIWINPMRPWFVDGCLFRFVAPAKAGAHNHRFQNSGIGAMDPKLAVWTAPWDDSKRAAVRFHGRLFCYNKTQNNTPLSLRGALCATTQSRATCTEQGALDRRACCASSR